MKNTILAIFLIAVAGSIHAQDTSSVFARITNAVKEYKIDTSDVPNDKITEKIKELRALKGGFNINEVMEYKIEEEIQKNPAAKDSMMRLAASFKNGKAKKWLDNAVIWIYRQEYTYDELKDMVKFYKTSAGQKMAQNFPIILLKSLMAAETIQKNLIFVSP